MNKVKVLASNPGVFDLLLKSKAAFDAFVPVVRDAKVIADVPEGCHPAVIINGAEWEAALEAAKEVMSKMPKEIIVRLFDNKYFYLVSGALREAKYPGKIYIVSDISLESSKNLIYASFDNTTEWIPVLDWDGKIPAMKKGVIWLFPSESQIKKLLGKRSERKTGVVKIGGIMEREAPNDTAAPVYKNGQPKVYSEGDKVEIVQVVSGEYYDWGKTPDGGWIAIGIGKYQTVDFE